VVDKANDRAIGVRRPGHSDRSVPVGSSSGTVKVDDSPSQEGRGKEREKAAQRIDSSSERGGPTLVPVNHYRPRPTMKEVATLAGVSLKTVSRVVNHEEGVAGPTAEAVLAAIEALGYRRNEVARNLRPGQRSNTLGLVIEDVGNPFYSAITKGAEEVASARGMMVLTASSEEQTSRERELIERMVQRQVDGLLLVPTSQSHKFLAHEIARGLCVVAVDRPALGVDTDVAVLDNEGGAIAAVQYLLGRGHSRIGAVGDGAWVWTAAERVRGYRLALERAGIEPDDRLVRLGARTVEEAEEAALSLLREKPPPTALFALNNRATVGVLQALLRARGQEVEVTGFDDFELSDMLSLPVSTVAHDAAELGRQATRLLLERLDGNASPPRTVTVPTSLTVRPRAVER